MTKTKIKRYSKRRGSVLSFVASVICTVVGFIISSPFTIIVIIMGHNSHHVSFLSFLMLMGFFIGAPLFIFGLINLLIGGRSAGSNTSTTELDISRIRYMAETEKDRR